MSIPKPQSSKNFRKTIKGMFKNRPNACLKGDTFDATHLDRIILRPKTALTEVHSSFYPKRRKMAFPEDPTVKLDPTCKTSIEVQELPDGNIFFNSQENRKKVYFILNFLVFAF